MQGSDDQKVLLEEMARLRAKRAETSDADIVEALDLKISQIQSKLTESVNASLAGGVASHGKPKETAPTSTPTSVPAVEVSEAAMAAPPTPEEAEAAEKFIRQSRVEKMRNNRDGATENLRKAAEIAPGSPSVLEALGDDLIERKKFKEGIAVYAKALALDPKNLGLERKHAQAVFQLQAAGTFEQQMQRGLSDSPFLSSDDAVASGKAAVLLSAFLPGLGHVTLGQTSRGFTIMAIWIVNCVFLLMRTEDLAGLGAFASGGNVRPNMIVLIPLLIGFIVYFGTLASLSGVAKVTSTRKPVDRPKPPVDLPFE